MTVYRVVVPAEESMGFFTTLIRLELAQDLFPFITKQRRDSMSCELRLSEEERLVLALAIPTATLTELNEK
jgi:hypothetical protein